MSHATSPARRPGRLRTITPPPPILDWTREMASLEEAGPELAVAFWRVLRKVRAWAETPPEDRAALFAINKKEACERLGCACGLAPGLVEAFGTFSVLVRAPGRMEPRQLAGACHQVHEWAEERSLIEVAMLFAEAAAFADPDDPAWANDAGRMCRRAARDERASSWYHRGYGLGARFDAPQEVIRAQIGYGNLMKDLGQHDEAKRFLERAARRAFYTGRKRQAGEAHHDLLLLSAETGAFPQAYRHARLAAKYYPLRHLRIPHLVHDFAFLLIRQSHFSAALFLLAKLLTRLHRSEEQVLVHSTIAWAAGGAGQRVSFDEAGWSVFQLIEKHNEFAPAALIHVAEGSRYFLEWEQAEKCATLAVDAARKRKDAALEREALELLEKIAIHESSPPELCPANQDSIEQLIRHFDGRLRKWKAPGQTAPEASADFNLVPLANGGV